MKNDDNCEEMDSFHNKNPTIYVQKLQESYSQILIKAFCNNLLRFQTFYILLFEL
jgi:hypothetical protein